MIAHTNTAEGTKRTSAYRSSPVRRPEVRVGSGPTATVDMSGPMPLGLGEPVRGKDQQAESSEKHQDRAAGHRQQLAKRLIQSAGLARVGGDGCNDHEHSGQSEYHTTSGRSGDPEPLHKSTLSRTHPL